MHRPCPTRDLLRKPVVHNCCKPVVKCLDCSTVVNFAQMALYTCLKMKDLNSFSVTAPSVRAAPQHQLSAHRVLATPITFIFLATGFRSIRYNKRNKLFPFAMLGTKLRVRTVRPKCNVMSTYLATLPFNYTPQTTLMTQ